MTAKLQSGEAYTEDGAALVRDIETFALRFVVLPPYTSLPLALWIVATHLFDVFETFPYLALLSPEKRCGKTRTTKLIELFSANPQSAVCPSEAVLFRLIESYHPTLIIDEAEILTARGDRADAIRAILNAGNAADTTVPRCAGQDHEVKFFSVFCPKVISAIRVCPDTVKDRSIVISMRRKQHGEQVERLIKRRIQEEANSLKGRIVRWVEQNRQQIEKVYDVIEIDFLNDRDLENFEPLFSVLVAAAPDRYYELSSAALALTKGKSDGDEDNSPSLRLLADIRIIWPRDEQHVLSSDLVTRLKNLRESPWGSEPQLDQRTLARMLKPYGVRSRSVRANTEHGWGYTRLELEDIFARYLRSEA